MLVLKVSHARHICWYTATMRAMFYHATFNVTDTGFHRASLTYLLWNIVVEYPDSFGTIDGRTNVMKLEVV